MLFSEPKIPQSLFANLTHLALATVSVLFSEPKIPQSLIGDVGERLGRPFQCSSASRKFLNNYERCGTPRRRRRFQCSSASRKFLNGDGPTTRRGSSLVSVLFSEPKIPQWRPDSAPTNDQLEFQCSSASRKFLNPDPRTCVHPYFRPR